MCDHAIVVLCARRIGGPSLNACLPLPVKLVTKSVREGQGKFRTVTDRYSFSIGNVTGLSPYVKGGIVTQVKMPTRLSFRSLEAAIKNPVNPSTSKASVAVHVCVLVRACAWRPTLAVPMPVSCNVMYMRVRVVRACVLVCVYETGTNDLCLVRSSGMGVIQMNDYLKMEPNAPHQLFVAAMGVWEFERIHGHLPVPNDDGHTEECFRAAADWNAAAKARGDFCVDEVSEELVMAYARHAAVEIQPMCTMFGGIVAHEIIKFTGKFTPINGWLIHDALEALPSDAIASEDRAPRGSRYDNLIQVFGVKLQVRALGCHGAERSRTSSPLFSFTECAEW